MDGARERPPVSAAGACPPVVRRLQSADHDGVDVVLRGRRDRHRGGCPWVSLAFTAPTPLLGWFSFRYGDRYAAARLPQLTVSKGIPMSNNRQEVLRALIDGKSDDEILDAVKAASGSYEAFIDESMLGMVDAFEPDAAEDCVIGYEITTPDGTYVYRVEVRGTTVTTERRDPTDARVVLGLALPDYLRLINGLLAGTEAFMTGHLKLRGDVMFAPQIERIFRRG